MYVYIIKTLHFYIIIIINYIIYRKIIMVGKVNQLKLLVYIYIKGMLILTLGAHAQRGL